MAKKIKVKLNPNKEIGYTVHSVGPGRKLTLSKEGKMKAGELKEADYSKDLENPAFINTVSREAKFRDSKSLDAVLNVMHNRMGQKGYGSSPLGVVSQKGQFAAYGKGPAKGMTDADRQNIMTRAKSIFSGSEKDITGGANEFRTTSAKNKPGGTQIGGNTFYKTGAFAKAQPKATPDVSKPTQVASNDSKPSSAPETSFKSYTPKEIQPKAPAASTTPEAPKPTQVASAPEAPKMQNPDQNITKVASAPAPTQVSQLDTNPKQKVAEGTIMSKKEKINEAIVNLQENKLNKMKQNFSEVLQEKAMEKLEERKKVIAANYFAQ